MAYQHQQLLTKELNLLHNQLINHSTHDYNREETRLHIDTYEKTYDKINKLIHIIYSCNQHLSEADQNKVMTLRKNIDQLYQYLDLAKFAKDLSLAQSLLNDNKYESAYKEYS